MKKFCIKNVRTMSVGILYGAYITGIYRYLARISLCDCYNTVSVRPFMYFPGRCGQESGPQHRAPHLLLVDQPTADVIT